MGYILTFAAGMCTAVFLILVGILLHDDNNE